MSLLPIIETPTYSVQLPISSKTVKFRPYLVKEQKILAMAKESGEKNALISAIIQIIENCTNNQIDINELPITDIEYLFYTIRARSESEIVSLKYKCENIVNNSMCGNTMDHKLNLLTDLQVINANISPNIELSENIGLKLKYPKFEVSNIDETKIPTPKEIFEQVAKNVDFIYDENSSYNASDIPLQNIVQWIGDLPVEQYAKIEEFFSNEPKIVKSFNIKCTKCGFDHKIVVEDIFDFFI